MNSSDTTPKEKTKSIDSEFSWNKYRRLPMTVWAMRMNRAFQCKTLDGALFGESGDWLVKGDDGYEFPVPDRLFRRHYIDRA